jgi:cyanate permease
VPAARCIGGIPKVIASWLSGWPRVTAAGIYFAVGDVGGFSGPSVMGLLKDLIGGFTAGLLMLATITVVMLLPTALLREPRA